MKKGDEIIIKIEDFAFGGKGFSKLPAEDGATLVVFVDNTFPGQTVKARVVKKRKKYVECSLIEIIERSPLEILLPYQEISGAPYIYVPITIQHQYKLSSTKDVYRKLGHIQNIEEIFDELISSPENYFYRNKMEYSFSSIGHDFETGKDVDNDFAFGFKRRGTWWKVENLEKPSGLFDEEFEEKLKEIRSYLKATNLPAWHPPKKSGFFRHLVVRKSFYQNQLLLNLVTSSEGVEKFNIQQFGDFLQGILPGKIAGFRHTINDNVADRAKIENGSSSLIFGDEKVVENLLGLEFEISMESFFQTNPKSAERLYQKALDYTFEENNLDGKVVMDLFCGTGTIGQILSRRSKNTKIIGVDIVEEAIHDARLNARRNHIDTIDFFAADVGKFLLEYPEYEGKIGTIVLDPPRAGIAPKTLRKIIRLGADRIVYISCNPSTQARDAETLLKAGYRFDKLSFVDQFPHTGHIEAIGKFIKTEKYNTRFE